MQSKDELEAWYQTPDPWDYKNTPDDIERKKRILAALPAKYKRALDIGCGEGWITKDLPAEVIHGLELSDTARARIPPPAIGVTKPAGKYDLIILTGVLYKQYDHNRMIDTVYTHAAKGATILTCHIKDWEHELPSDAEYIEEFPYREYVEILRRYKW
jgi:hypothetical protein